MRRTVRIVDITLRVMHPHAEREVYDLNGSRLLSIPWEAHHDLDELERDRNSDGGICSRQPVPPTEGYNQDQTASQRLDRPRLFWQRHQRGWFPARYPPIGCRRAGVCLQRERPNVVHACRAEQGRDARGRRGAKRMHHLDLIVTLTAGLTTALVLGYISHRLHLSPIVGYLMAGVVIGPATPGYVADRHLAEQLAEVGIILLMFGVGLQFHFKELLAVRRIAIPGAIGQSLFATALGIGAGLAFGWEWTAGLVFGLAISVASTVVLVRVLADNNDLHTPTGHIAVGWLVVEDLFTVVVLVLLPVLFGGESIDAAHLPVALGLALLKIGLLVVCVFLFAGRVIPWLLAHVAMTRSRELFTLT